MFEVNDRNETLIIPATFTSFTIWWSTRPFGCKHVLIDIPNEHWLTLITNQTIPGEFLLVNFAEKLIYYKADNLEGIWNFVKSKGGRLLFTDKRDEFDNWYKKWIV